ncbi:TRAP transporter small permease [Maritalea porphyrae]|uniref:TRAP transporter small permease n=1 Tax=Maritalea porphyrae TaxID=880732 RepID=UPI0022AFF248|nr:TRAP transporter small permease [Maritalea porphyrae]MCZ4273824.1 TRAP transporter small permease [Maritalea porphyrae]
MSELAGVLSARLNWVVERIVALLMLLLVLDVWIGVIDRYIFHWQLPWPEALARYLMIWAAMLAISAGIARREHIGLQGLISKFPESLRRVVVLSLDLVTFALFFYVFWYGIGFAQTGGNRQAMIFGMTLLFPFAAIPVAGAICAIQTLLVALRDRGELITPSVTGMAE